MKSVLFMWASIIFANMFDYYILKMKVRILSSKSYIAHNFIIILV